MDATELANAIREQMKKNIQQKNENIIKAREYALKYYSIAASAEYFSKLIRG